MCLSVQVKKMSCNEDEVASMSVSPSELNVASVLHI